MTEMQPVRIPIQLAISRLRRALDCVSADEALAHSQAAQELIEDAVKAARMARPAKCPNCPRTIVDTDPVLEGFCSTICRIGYRKRLALHFPDQMAVT